MLLYVDIISFTIILLIIHLINHCTHFKPIKAMFKDDVQFWTENLQYLIHL